MIKVFYSKTHKQDEAILCIVANLKQYKTHLPNSLLNLPHSSEIKQNNKDPLMQKMAEDRRSIFNYYVWENSWLVFILMVNNDNR